MLRDVPQRFALVGFVLGLLVNLALALGAPQISWLWWNVAGFFVALIYTLAALLLKQHKVGIVRYQYPKMTGTIEVAVDDGSNSCCFALCTPRATEKSTSASLDALTMSKAPVVFLDTENDLLGRDMVGLGSTEIQFACGKRMKNRYAGTAHKCQSNEDGTLTEDEFNWLTLRAKGEFGLTMTCAAHVQQIGQGFPGQLGVFSDDHLAGHSRLAEAIKAQDSLAVEQLHHAGML